MLNEKGDKDLQLKIKVTVFKLHTAFTWYYQIPWNNSDLSEQACSVKWKQYSWILLWQYEELWLSKGPWR